MKDKFKQKEKAAVEKRHWVRLTRCCNNHCIFCLDSENQNGTYLSFDRIEENLKKGRKEKIKRIILSGGDPTVHPNFLTIVKKAKNLGYNHIQIVTNGRMFAYKDFLEKAIIAGVDEITFSIHGHNKNLYEKQSQVKGSFEQALQGLLNASNCPNLIVNIDIVINKLNYKYLAEIIKFYINLGISEFDLLQVMPFGRAWKNKDKVFYDIKKALPYFKKAFLFSKNPDFYIWTNRFPPQFLEGFEDLIQHPIKIFDEVKGRNIMFKRFLEEDEIMSCYGMRCQYCFLKNFCRDLVKFQKEKILKSRTIPDCLKHLKVKPSSKQLKYPADIYQFSDFYINHRYFVKSLRCNDCKLNQSCQGMHINYIRKFGFKKLNPIKK